MTLPERSDNQLTASVIIAHEALNEANQRRKVAIEALVDYCLRAVVAGEDLDAIMDACGFKDGDAVTSPLMSMLGVGGMGDRQTRFGGWLGQALADLIYEGEK